MGRKSRFFQLVVAASLVALAAAAVAAADTIYLKNGRVIRTKSAVIDGDRVLFTQYGHPVAIPLAQVERVVEDEYEDPAPLPARPAPEPAGQTPPAAGVPAAASATAADQPVDPEETREYWQNRVRAIYAGQEALEIQMRELRREERAFLFSHRSTAPTRRKIEDVQARLDELEQAMPNLRREARRKGIPAGWLRVTGVNSD